MPLEPSRLFFDFFDLSGLWGIESFEGSYLHSWHYRSAEDLQGKRVLVVGIGNSGADLAVDISRVAEKVQDSLFCPMCFWQDPNVHCVLSWPEGVPQYPERRLGGWSCRGRGSTFWPGFLTGAVPDWSALPLLVQQDAGDEVERGAWPQIIWAETKSWVTSIDKHPCVVRDLQRDWDQGCYS